jgi:hypothetical protein
MKLLKILHQFTVLIFMEGVTGLSSVTVGAC